MGRRKHPLTAERAAEQLAIGARIRERREALDLTGIEVAKLADVSEKHYYLIERGGAMPSGPTLGRIAKVLRESTDWLLTGKRKNGNGHRKNGNGKNGTKKS